MILLMSKHYIMLTKNKNHKTPNVQKMHMRLEMSYIKEILLYENNVLQKGENNIHIDK